MKNKEIAKPYKSEDAINIETCIGIFGLQDATVDAQALLIFYVYYRAYDGVNDLYAYSDRINVPEKYSKTLLWHVMKYSQDYSDDGLFWDNFHKRSDVDFLRKNLNLSLEHDEFCNLVDTFCTDLLKSHGLDWINEDDD